MLVTAVNRWTGVRLAGRPVCYMFLAALLGSRLAAAPVIASVANAASNITFNSPIAQGSIFVIRGSGLGPENLSIAPEPFQSTSLSGTSVEVTVGSTTVSALLYYTSASQVAGLLPSRTPTGAGTFTVTYNGQKSNSVGKAVVAGNVGLFTLDSSGRGPATVTYPDYSLVSAFGSPSCGGPYTACGAANPGDTLVAWATGLGPVSGDDASGAGLGQAMPAVALKLWLGGVEAPVSYQGRSGCCVGLDQVVFTVPDNVPAGCAVPLVAQVTSPAGSIIGNSTVIPVARESRNCTPDNPAFASLSLASFVAGGPIAIGDVGLSKQQSTNGAGLQDAVRYEFFRLNLRPGVAPFAASTDAPPPPGACIVHNSTNPENEEFFFVDAAELDGGASIRVLGPKGAATVPRNDGHRVLISPAGTFLGPGEYTVSGSGGRDVGPFSAAIRLPATPVLTSPQPSANLTVARSSGLTVTWQGGEPGGNVEIHLESATNAAGAFGAWATCVAPAGSGAFTIPPYVLLALPSGNFTGFQFGPASTIVPFTAGGIDLGSVHSESVSATFGGFRLN